VLSQMAPSWVKDPIPRLEDLAEARVGTPGPGLPSHAPVVERPTLQLLLGSIPEGDLGAFGSAERRTAESSLIAGFVQQYGPHLARGGAIRPGQEGSPDMGWLVSFQEGDEHTQLRLGMVDLGIIDLHLPGRVPAIPVRVRQGPPRLNSRWVRVIVSGLHEDFMVPGVIQCLLESAGYVAGGEGGFVLRAEHAGEHGGEIAVIAPSLGRCGVVIGIVRPPASDPTLSRLPKNLQDFGGGGAARIRVSHHSSAASTPTPPVPHPPTVAAALTGPLQGHRAGPRQRDMAPPPPHLPLPTPRRQSPLMTGRTHPATQFQPSPFHLPFPPPPRPPRRTPPAAFSSFQGRGRECSSAQPRTLPLPSSQASHSTRAPPHRGFVPAAHPIPTLQLSSVPLPLSRALDPILDMGAHLPGDFRGIGRYPDPPPGPAPLLQRGYVGGRGDIGGGSPARHLGAVGDGRMTDVPMMDAQVWGEDGASHALETSLRPPPGFSHPRIGEPMEIDGGMQGGDQGTDRGLALGGQRLDGPALPPAGHVTARGNSPSQDLAGPSRMDIDASPVQPALPGDPLVDSCMNWLADNEDPSRTIGERRLHMLRLVLEYPSVFARHAQDGTNPPPPEVRTALRDIGGLLPADGADDPTPPLPPSPPSSPLTQDPCLPSPAFRGTRPQRDRRNRRQPPVRGEGPAASAGRRSRPPAEAWHSSSRLPHTSSYQPQSQPSIRATPPSGSRRRRQ
jgi:hypothetical protein